MYITHEIRSGFQRDTNILNHGTALIPVMEGNKILLKEFTG